MKEKLDAIKDYPIYEKRPELIETLTGKGIDEITIDNILSGNISPEDCRISDNMLEYQAQIQESFGNRQVAENFRRAAEMTRIPDKRILEIYNSLRPNVSTKKELKEIAKELEIQYNAAINAALVREAAEVYEKRNMLKNS